MRTVEVGPIRIDGGQVLTADGLRNASVTCHGNQITHVSQHTPSVEVPQPEREIRIDATDLIVAPGFVDLQINGGHGIDLASDPAAMWRLGALLPRHGVTSFLPTIVSSPAATTESALAALEERPADYVGAEALGLHFEGPMLNPNRRGAHRAKHLRSPSVEVIAGWSRASGVRLVTLAPELPNVLQLISDLVAEGVAVAAGHTEATSSETREAIECGITSVTHVFNAMAPLNHREPSILATVLGSPALVAGLIADGIHVHPDVVAVVWNAKGPEGIALVTDAVAPMGEPHGTFEFSGETITSDRTGVRNSQGTLAGSNLTMDQAVRNLQRFTGCLTQDALTAATRTPADLIGEVSRGRIEPRAAADLILLDQELEVLISVCGGRLAYVAPEAQHLLG